MTYRVTTHTALVSNLAAANTTVMLCRANIKRIQMTPEEQSDIAWRVHLQMRELAGILAHVKKAVKRTEDLPPPVASAEDVTRP